MNEYCSYVEIDGDRNSNRNSIRVDTYPDQCPICNVGIKPIFLDGFQTGYTPTADTTIELVFRCPMGSCGAIFLAQYYQKSHLEQYYLLEISRRLVYLPEISFPKEISDLSRSFVRIYYQAKIADDNGLTEICGTGYRRALEFLVKDYLISIHPNDDQYDQKIAKIQLGPCINEIDDVRIHKMAKRAAWLGNDETHYYRKWESHDLQDLKSLIKITVNAIHNDLLGRKYEESMPGN